MRVLEIIFIAVLLISLGGISAILFRKIPILVGLREKNISGQSLISKIKRGIKKLPGAGKIDYDLYLQKMLSRIRVLTMKTESKTGNWLERLRQKRNGHNGADEYWEELKKIKKGE
ncbi:MAG: hypothetical protein HYW69_02640 [Candidatus Nealsonbacteria bacterium]|nr:hypothetical protein [Candidatus Nealsonbacteria bacterium]